LEYAVTDWRHQLLGDISPDCFISVGTFSTAVGANSFRTVDEARAAAKQLLPRLQWLRGIHSQIASAKAFENLPSAEQSARLIPALVARRNADEKRIAKLESQCMALEARIGKIEGTKSPTRSATKTKRKSSS
jgi:hypothetical protein